MASDGPDSFNEAKAYDSNSSSQREDGGKLIDRMQLEEGSKVLDLGCGTGNLTVLLASKVGPKGQVVGIDPNLNRLAIAQEKYSAPNVVYQEGRAEDIPGTDYDAVFANYMLHYCNDKERVFTEVAKSLKKGGKFGYMTIVDLNLVEYIFTAEGLQIVLSINHIPSSEDLCKLAEDNEFRNVYTSEKVRIGTYKDFSLAIEFYRTHYPLCEKHFDIEAVKKLCEEDGIFYDISLRMDILEKI